MKRFFAVGMAGHIDHGKTTLTKALTGIDTDRLKEEKMRGLSIEPGFASLVQNEQMEVSLIDVPGHERFIRQMIAGVAGVDFVVLVIAADEGVMPQTVEHIQILSILGIKEGFVVLSKVDQVDDAWLALVKEDVKQHLQKTFLENAPMFLVDSVSHKGIDQLKMALIENLTTLNKPISTKPFRLPIDHVFTVKGQGVVVRGTIYDGSVQKDDELLLLPKGKQVRVRQMQSHRESYERLTAGQRAALNITGISHEQISRGDVLVANDYYQTSKRIDVAFKPLKDMQYPLKQRQWVKLFIGTSEVMGKVIFFDRNTLNPGEVEEIVCQIECEKAVVASRGDRFILRRPSPAETIGGGWVIEPTAKKYRFGQKTVEKLLIKKDGTAIERVKALLEEQIYLPKEDIIREASISKAEFNQLQKELIRLRENYYTLSRLLKSLEKEIFELLEDFHQRYPLRVGIDKASVLSRLSETYPEAFIEEVLDQLFVEEKLKSTGPFIAKISFKPFVPKKWEETYQALKEDLIHANIDVPKWSQLMDKYDMTEHMQREFYHHFIETRFAYLFEADRLITYQAVEQALQILRKATNEQPFTLQQAREALQLTRKNLIPFLELLDQLGYTRRKENRRLWLK